ncbi:MAG TPA: hypothetical protein VE544_09635, partial [Nitrososphaeraceae archaeon]|nr:hypothetical protein [Nitrososphaeraceae archaeon]
KFVKGIYNTDMYIRSCNDTNITASSAMSGSTILTTTYGPDLNSPITGTYHVEGPLLVEPTPYLIMV